MVLSHIHAAGDQGWRSCLRSTNLTPQLTGIWTKHIKFKTELHQTVMDRCLKSLVQKKLIKTVPDVRVRKFLFVLASRRTQTS
jgi:hypothetical protein